MTKLCSFGENNEKNPDNKTDRNPCALHIEGCLFHEGRYSVRKARTSGALPDAGPIYIGSFLFFFFVRGDGFDDQAVAVLYLLQEDRVGVIFQTPHLLSQVGSGLLQLGEGHICGDPL